MNPMFDQLCLNPLTILHSEKAKILIVYNFGLSVCNWVNTTLILFAGQCTNSFKSCQIMFKFLPKMGWINISQQL